MSPSDHHAQPPSANAACLPTCKQRGQNSDECEDAAFLLATEVPERRKKGGYDIERPKKKRGRQDTLD